MGKAHKELRRHKAESQEDSYFPANGHQAILKNEQNAEGKQKVHIQWQPEQTTTETPPATHRRGGPNRHNPWSSAFC